MSQLTITDVRRFDKTIIFFRLDDSRFITSPGYPDNFGPWETDHGWTMIYSEACAIPGFIEQVELWEFYS